MKSIFRNRNIQLNPSIRTQLLSWLVIPLLLLLVVGAGLTYGLAIEIATDAYDKSLLDSVYSVFGCVQMSGDKVVVDLPPAALAILRDNMKDKVWYQVLDEKNNVLAGDTVIPRPVFDKDEDDSNAQCRDDVINNEEVRIACIKFPVPSNPKLNIYIQVGETLHGREQIADEILIGVVLPQLGMVVFTLLVVWYGVAKGLTPLNLLRDAIAQRTPADLSPIATDKVPKEVRPLVRAINELLERLEKDIQAQRRFVANAAHQLRTPIAGLKTQTELAQRQQDPADVQHALTLIRTSAERAARLVNQLLALARTEPGAANQRLWQQLNLNDVGRSVSREFVQAALAKNIDLGFEESPCPVMIHGDPGTLHELFANLVDNAVLYTPKGGHVTVKVILEQNPGVKKQAIVVVEDDGPGIPLEEREQVFERFYRLLDHGLSGTGLGLAIVKEIAKLHDADVTLKETSKGRGTSVWVSFALLTATIADKSDDQHASKENPLVSAS